MRFSQSLLRILIPWLLAANASSALAQSCPNCQTAPLTTNDLFWVPPTWVPATFDAVPASPTNVARNDRRSSPPVKKVPTTIFDDDSESEPPQFTSPGRNVPFLVPTERPQPAANEPMPRESAPTPAPAPSNAAPRKPTVAEKIALRYSDPRVVRLLGMLTPENAEDFYSEVCRMIDERHISPASYTRRVDGGLEHLIQALEVPAFAEAAKLRGSPAAIETAQSNLRQLHSQNHGRTVGDAINVLRRAQSVVGRSVSINPAAVTMAFLYGATDSLDQFSMLLPPEKTGGPSVGLRDSVVGIGIEVEQHPEGLKIVKLIPGGPAAMADLRRGDVITRVDGNELKQLDVNRAVDYITGQVGTQISLEAVRNGRSGRVTLTRQRIALESVSEVRMEDSARGVAYIKLDQFAESTMNEIDNALMKLHRQGMQSLILDLRGNPGGLLTTAIALSDRFLPGGTIVSTRGRLPEDNSVELAHSANTWRMPLVVLVDHNSASASEIFAAAIQENHRGLIIGETSYGKGTVQTLFPLQSVPAGLRLTTAKFYSPDGREMAGAGVTPDIQPRAGQTADGKDATLIEAVRRVNDTRVKDMARQPRMGVASEEPRVAA